LTVNIYNGVVTNLATQSAAPAYCAKDYTCDTRDTANHTRKSMTTSLAIQDRKQSTTSGIVYAALICRDVKRGLQGKINHQDQHATRENHM
jgi:L-lysine 2,3-aminomutase